MKAKITKKQMWRESDIKKISQVIIKQTYEICWRRGGDSNPRYPLLGTTV